MKKTNKGFSLVELIIVIAIMAILAGALAPALIKYINKSRASSAVSNAQQIASGIQSALSNEAVFDSSADWSGSYTALQAITTGDNASLAAELKRTLGTTTTHKCKKSLKGTTCAGSNNYFVEIHLQPTGTQDMVDVWVASSANTDWLAYPTVGSEWQD